MGKASESGFGNRFGEIAVREGFATRAQVGDSLEIQEKLKSYGVEPKRLGEIMVEKGHLKASDVESILAVQVQLRKQGASRTETWRGRAPSAADVAALQEARKAAETEVEEAPPPTPTIPGYEILELLGKGGMGAVYKARQKSLDRVVALKVLPPSAAKDESFIRRFISEARTVAKLNHENIIGGIDVGDADGTYYFAMEHVEGTSLAKLIERDGPVPEKRALEIAIQMGKALEHAHKHGLVHRDVKPQNILVAKNDVAKLCDLGLAKQIDKGPKPITATDMGMPLGTPHYLSPEQARGEADVDIRSDIYSLGASLYHMLTGVPPFEGQSPMVLMTKHLTEEPIPPRRRNPDVEVTKEASDLVLTMMEKEKERRHQNPTELLEDLQRVLSGKKAKGGPPPKKAKKERRDSDPGDEDEPKRRATRVRGDGSGGDKMPMIIAAVAMIGVVGILIAATQGGALFSPDRESAPIQREAEKAYMHAEGQYQTAKGGQALEENRAALRQMFQRVIDSFPNTEAAEKARRRLEELR